MSYAMYASYALQIVSYAVWFPLMFVTINAVRRRGVRHYPLVFTYLAVTMLIALIQAPTALAFHRTWRQGAWLQVVQAVGEGAAYALLLVLVISLIYQATARSGTRRLVRTALIAGALLVMFVSFAVHYDSSVKLGVWITPWTRDLNFCAAILDLALWALLLGSKNRDTRLLLLTGGMGIMFAGDAIGESVRHFAIRNRSNATFLVGNALTAIADSTFLYVWWRTFRRETTVQKARADGAGPG